MKIKLTSFYQNIGIALKKGFFPSDIFQATYQSIPRVSGAAGEDLRVPGQPPGPGDHSISGYNPV